MNYSCLLFDLDGTLVDSGSDLSNSVNLMLSERGFKPLEDESVLRFVGEGMELLIERSLTSALGHRPDAGYLGDAIQAFRRHYSLHLLDETRPNPEVEETLDYFSLLPKAVVTNKPLGLTLTLLQGLGLTKYFVAVVGGDSLPRRKPSPEPLVEAARLCHRPVDECLMVGDSRIDIEAGRAAGMKTCGYVPGFRGRAELAIAKADILIERFSELRQVVED